MKLNILLVLLLSGCSTSQNVGQALLDASVLGPRMAAARESRMLTEEKVSVVSQWTDSNLLVVSGNGSAATTAALVEEHVALEAATKAIKAGFRFIAPVAFEDTSSVAAYTVNRPYEISITADSRGHLSGNTYNGTTHATATTTGGPRSGQVLLPARNVSFRMFDQRPEGIRESQYFDAIALYNRLGAKHLDDFQPISGL